jgi:hypothetical protein
MSIQPVPAKQYNFRYVPSSPTKEAFDNRPFNEIRGLEAFMERLRQYEKDHPFTQMEGYIRFRPGVSSKYYDGTEASTYDDRKWYELGYTSCSGQCCFSIPNPKLLAWRPSPDDATEEMKAANNAELHELWKETERVTEANYAKHLANPKPMPKFKRKTIAPKREWQEFRRVKGPGGMIDQLKQIDNFQDINLIHFKGMGWFYVEPL